MIDKQLELCVDLDMEGTAGEYLSDILDMGAAGNIVQGGVAANDMGCSDTSHVYCRITEAFAPELDGMGAVQALTVRIQLIAADNAALSSGAVVLFDTGVVAYTTFVLDYFPPELHGRVIPHSSKRYLGLKITTADFDATAGKVTARISTGRQTNPTILL